MPSALFVIAGCLVAGQLLGHLRLFMGVRVPLQSGLGLALVAGLAGLIFYSLARSSPYAGAVFALIAIYAWAPVAAFGLGQFIAAIIARLSQAARQFLQQPDIKERYFAGGVEAVGSTPQELETEVKADTARIQKLIQALGIKIE